MFWFIVGVIILLFLVDFIIGEIISEDIVKELSKITIFKIRKIVSMAHSYIMYMILISFFFIMIEEIFFRLLPAMFMLAIFHSTFMLLLGLIFASFIDAYVHRIKAETLIPGLPKQVLDVYLFSVFILQLILALAFYHIFVVTYTSSNMLSAIVYAFALTTMIHFTYDLIVFFMGLEEIERRLGG